MLRAVVRVSSCVLVSVAVASCATGASQVAPEGEEPDDDGGGTGGGAGTVGSGGATTASSSGSGGSDAGGAGGLGSGGAGGMDDGPCPGGCGANADCVITPDSSQCECKEGWTGDGQTCTDVDECAVPGTCDPNATCANEPGSFSCTCNPGFFGNGTTCSDIDECASNNGGCDPNATCVNEPGGSTCTCNTGFTDNGTTCADIDECASNNGGCSADATCANLPGSFSCTCNPDFVGNGFVCVPGVGSGLLSMDFGGTVTTKVGAAAIGNTPVDVWNAVGQGSSSDWLVGNLVWADGSPSGISAHGTNLPGIWGWQSAVGDAMYDSFIYSWSGASAAITLIGLPGATYDVVVYGTTGPGNNSGFFVTVHDDEASPAISTSATKFTSAGADANAAAWVEDGQYVVHSGVVLTAGQVLRVNVTNGVQGTGNAGCVVNGMQLLKY